MPEGLGREDWSMIKIRKGGGPFFNVWRILTNTSFADFTIGRFDERQGGDFRL
jgi:hypothetical protein